MSNENSTPQNEDRIRVFKSTNKKTDKSPDFWGKLNIGEVEYDVAMWNNTSKTGTSYLSGFVRIEESEGEGSTETKSAMEPNEMF